MTEVGRTTTVGQPPVGQESSSWFGECNPIKFCKKNWWCFLLGVGAFGALRAVGVSSQFKAAKQLAPLGGVAVTIGAIAVQSFRSESDPAPEPVAIRQVSTTATTATPTKPSQWIRLPKDPRDLPLTREWNSLAGTESARLLFAQVLKNVKGLQPRITSLSQRPDAAASCTALAEAICQLERDGNLDHLPKLKEAFFAFGRKEITYQRRARAAKQTAIRKTLTSADELETWLATNHFGVAKTSASGACMFESIAIAVGLIKDSFDATQKKEAIQAMRKKIVDALESRVTYEKTHPPDDGQNYTQAIKTYLRSECNHPTHRRGLDRELQAKLARHNGTNTLDTYIKDNGCDDYIASLRKPTSWGSHIELTLVPAVTGYEVRTIAPNGNNYKHTDSKGPYFDHVPFKQNLYPKQTENSSKGTIVLVNNASHYRPVTLVPEPWKSQWNA